MREEHFPYIVWATTIALPTFFILISPTCIHLSYITHNTQFIYLIYLPSDKWMIKFCLPDWNRRLLYSPVCSWSFQFVQGAIEDICFILFTKFETYTVICFICLTSDAFDWLFEWTLYTDIAFSDFSRTYVLSTLLFWKQQRRQSLLLVVYVVYCLLFMLYFITSHYLFIFSVQKK